MNVERRIIFIVALMIFATPFASAQLGIFEGTADWGPLGNVKTPGEITVTGTGSDAVYTILGNGDDIWGTEDEGFFVYAKRSGSWRLSARVIWDDPYINDWSKIGLMMRADADDASSSHYSNDLRGAAMGDSVYAQWRVDQGGSSFSSQFFEEDGTTPVDSVNAVDFEIYLSITHYAELGLVVSEYSYDGNEWFVGHTLSIDFPDEIAYGLVITSHEDDEVLVQATAYDVVLQEVEPVVSANRTISAKTFIPGNALDVTLDLFNPSGTPITTTITETIPQDFTVSDISDGGTFSNGSITWNLEVASGNSLISYKTVIPGTYNPSVSGYGKSWTGTVGELGITGANAAYYVDVEIGDELFSFDFENPAQFDEFDDLAGFFDIEDGVFYELLDADGPLVTATGDPTLSDVAITVQAMGLVENADWGIAFRISDINNHYSWQFVNGNLEFISYVGGTRTTLYTEPYAEELNVWQEFTVIAKDNVFYMYFEGELKAVVEDDNLTAGQVGFFGWVNAGTAIEIGGFGFDNMVVSTVKELTGISEWSLF